MKRFLTEYMKGDELFSGHVDACDFEHAESVAALLEPPQKVIGVVYAIVRCASWVELDADRFAQAIASEGGEPPNASEFD